MDVIPKRVAWIYRFARLILSVDVLHPVNWSDLAHAAGYFDQAHLSKEFKDFTGHTPTEISDPRRQFPAENRFPPDSGPMPATRNTTTPVRESTSDSRKPRQRMSGPCGNRSGATVMGRHLFDLVNGWDGHPPA